MSIIKLLNENLFSLEKFNIKFNLLKEYNIGYKEYLMLLEGKFDEPPKDYKVLLNNEYGKKFSFVVDARPIQKDPPKLDGESDTDYKNRIDNIPKPPIKRYVYDVAFNMNCEYKLASISFTANGGYNTENHDQAVRAMIGVAYCIGNALKLTECPINILKFAPIFSQVGEIRHIPAVNLDGTVDIDHNSEPYEIPIGDLFKDTTFESDVNDSSKYEELLELDGDELSSKIKSIDNNFVNDKIIIYENKIVGGREKAEWEIIKSKLLSSENWENQTVEVYNPRLKKLNKRSRTYHTLSKFLPEFGRTMEKIQPPDGISDRKIDGGAVTIYLVPIDDENQSPKVNMEELISNNDVDGVKSAIENGYEVKQVDIIRSFQTRNVNMIRLLAQTANVKNTTLIEASNSDTGIYFLDILIQFADHEIDYNELIWGPIRLDNIHIFKKIISTGVDINEDHITSIIRNGAREILKYILQVHSLAKMALPIAIRLQKLDAVKMILRTGVKITPDIIRIQTSREIKDFITKLMWKPSLKDELLKDDDDDNTEI